MEIQPISYKRVIYIINQLIIILDEIDNKIINEQKAYENKIITMMIKPTFLFFFTSNLITPFYLYYTLTKKY